MTGVTLKYIRHSVAGITTWPVGLECLSHKDQARVYQFSRDVCHGHILSAGFVKFEAGLPVCYGRSDSLGIASIPGDDTAALRAEWGMTCQTCGAHGLVGGFVNSAAPGYEDHPCPECCPAPIELTRADHAMADDISKVRSRLPLAKLS